MNLQGAGDRRCSLGKSKGFLDGWHVDEGLLDFWVYRFRFERLRMVKVFSLIYHFFMLHQHVARSV